MPHMHELQRGASVTPEEAGTFIRQEIVQQVTALRRVGASYKFCCKTLRKGSSSSHTATFVVHFDKEVAKATE